MLNNVTVSTTSIHGVKKIRVGDTQMHDSGAIWKTIEIKNEDGALVLITFFATNAENLQIEECSDVV